jgi:hypothetical protein
MCVHQPAELKELTDQLAPNQLRLGRAVSEEEPHSSLDDRFGNRQDSFMHEDHPAYA